MIEVWKNTPHPNYEVSILGKVRNKRTMRVLKPMRTGSKRKSGQRSKVRFSTTPRWDMDVASLVLSAFISPRPEGSHALHRSPNTEDNRLDNLYWGTAVDNMKDMLHQFRGGHQKLSATQVSEIRKRRLAGESGRKLSVEYNISEQRVCDIHKGRTSL